jgi:hypothetical protein
MTKPFTVTRAEARELKRRSRDMDVRGGGISHAVVHAKWLAKLGRELREMVRTYDGSGREAKKLLEALLIAEQEGVPNVSAIRHELALKMEKRRAA